MTNEQSCGTCRYWRENSPGYSEGSCKRYPPQPDLLQLAADIKAFDFSAEKFACESAFYWAQPCTDSQDWCGEWSANEPSPKVPPS